MSAPVPHEIDQRLGISPLPDHPDPVIRAAAATATRAEKMMEQVRTMVALVVAIERWKARR